MSHGNPSPVPASPVATERDYVLAILSSIRMLPELTNDGVAHIDACFDATAEGKLLWMDPPTRAILGE